MDKQIELWIKEGIITRQQAQEMQKHHNNPISKSKKKIIEIISIVLGIAASAAIIYFVLLKWDVIPDGIRVAALIILTFISASLGYYFRSVKPRPKISILLFFLSIILFGNLVFTTASVYSSNPDFNFHYLILLWISAILPFAYIFKSKPMSLLSSVLLIIWFSFFILIEDKFIYVSASIYPFAYYIFGLFFFCFGKINEFAKPAMPAAEIFQKVGMFIICLSAYLMTYTFFVSDAGKLVFDIVDIGNSANKLTHIAVVILSVMFLTSFFANPARKNSIIESVLTVVLIVSCIAISSTVIPFIAVNSLFVFIAAMLILIGYRKKDLFYTNIGSGFIALFILSKYGVFCWNIFLPHFFFMLGAALLILSAFIFEIIRRKFKKSFLEIHNTSEYALKEYSGEKK
ncbi:MAG: DUF2157 domain-containing protein [Elusimicrobiota bacterium]|jgi:uncharacterized membrane protein|nr:DUF2157 domain-containing protein [Elusimicrobiota bacterium]